jgi:hypothetical protein
MRNLVRRLWSALSHDPYGSGDATAELTVQYLELQQKRRELERQVAAELARREKLS